MIKFLTILLVLVWSGVLGQEIAVKRLKINSPKDDFCPHLYKDGMVMSSNRKNSIKQSYFDPEGISLSDIYFAPWPLNKNTPLIPFEWNTIDSTEGCATTSRDGQTIYFAKTIPPTKKKNIEKYTKIGLMKSVQVNGAWTKPEPLPFNNHRFNFSQPYWDETNQRLFFTSDMPAGKGGMDIWYVTKGSVHEWSEPINLGSRVNSKGNEVFPTLNERGVLYFSTDKKSGYGGYDIYSYHLDGQQSKKLPKPINSKSNDYSFISPNQGNKGYFVSDRWGNQDDIYSFDRKITFPDSSIQTVDAKKCYTFYEENPPPDTQEMAYQWDFGDGFTVVGNHEIKHCYQAPGIYQINLSIKDLSTGLTLADVAQTNLNIESLAEYSLHSENWSGKELKMVLEENQPENNEIELYWKYNDTVYFDLEHLIIKPPLTGEYRVDAYIVGDVKDVALFKVVFFLGDKASSSRIRLVPSNFEQNHALHQYFDQHPALHHTEAILLINEELKNRHHIWLSTLVDQFKFRWGINIRITLDNSSEHLTLQIDEN